MQTYIKGKILGLMLLTSTFGLVFMATPVVACSDNSNWNGDMGCGMSCSKGDTVNVVVQGDGEVWGAADCGGAHAGCGPLPKSCSGTSTDTAFTAESGNCYGYNDAGTGGHITCGTGAGANTELLLELLEGKVDCDKAQAMQAAGFTSLVYREILPNGDLQTTMAYDEAGCVERVVEIVNGLDTDPCDDEGPKGVYCDVDPNFKLIATLVAAIADAVDSVCHRNLINCDGLNS